MEKRFYHIISILVIVIFFSAAAICNFGQATAADAGDDTSGRRMLLRVEKTKLLMRIPRAHPQQQIKTAQARMINPVPRTQAIRAQVILKALQTKSLLSRI